jgi:uncharacterized protein (TIGR00725 family)
VTPRGYVAVVGPSGDPGPVVLEAAEEVGHRLASAGVVVVTGGGTGVMTAASRGAAAAGGTALGLLPGSDRRDGNPHLTLSLPTGLGELRNALLVRSADALVAVGGSWGTLSEVALACRTGVPVFALHGWYPPADGGPVAVTDPREAVERVLGVL